MANELRIRQNFLGGRVEDSPLSSAATTLTSSALAAAVAVGSTQHMPIILDPDGIGGAPEIAYITDHAAAATTATILRGQEGTVARQHNQDMEWVHGPILSDVQRQTSLTDTTGAGPTVGVGAITRFGSVTSFTPVAAGVVYISSTATASNGGAGNQGAFVYPTLHIVDGSNNSIGGIDGAANPDTNNVGVVNIQVIANPLNNTPISGFGSYVVVPQFRYRLVYVLKSGSGTGSVTFAALASSITINHLGA